MAVLLLMRAKEKWFEKDGSLSCSVGSIKIQGQTDPVIAHQKLEDKLQKNIEELALSEGLENLTRHPNRYGFDKITKVSVGDVGDLDITVPVKLEDGRTIVTFTSQYQIHRDSTETINKWHCPLTHKAEIKGIGVKPLPAHQDCDTHLRDYLLEHIGDDIDNIDEFVAQNKNWVKLVETTAYKPRDSMILSPYYLSMYRE